MPVRANRSQVRSWEGQDLFKQSSGRRDWAQHVRERERFPAALAALRVSPDTGNRHREKAGSGFLCVQAGCDAPTPVRTQLSPSPANRRLKADILGAKPCQLSAAQMLLFSTQMPRVREKTLISPPGRLHKVLRPKDCCVEALRNELCFHCEILRGGRGCFSSTGGWVSSDW